MSNNNNSNASSGTSSNTTRHNVNQGNGNNNNISNSSNGGSSRFNNNNNNRSNNNGNTRRTGNSNRNRAPGTSNKNTPKFEGKCGELKNHIFEYNHYKQADQHVNTKREIEEYIGRTYKYGTDVKISLENLKVYDIPEPGDRPTGDAKIYIWQKQVDEHIKRQIALEENLKTAYTLIWGQCSDMMRAKIEASKNYSQMRSTYDSIMLLKELKDVTFRFEDQKYIYESLYLSYKNFFNFRQKNDMSITQYLETFNNMVDVMEQHGGILGTEPQLAQHILDEDSMKRNLFSYDDDEDDDDDEEDDKKDDIPEKRKPGRPKKVHTPDASISKKSGMDEGKAAKNLERDFLLVLLFIKQIMKNMVL